ncbi:hypothetical protein ALC60_06984 [Trachymyrmex zeteki]|uniref:Uncharacterized protein n=1 Tax=Mycetomoellerius zeteki TaxID=64791 RepID=A0A151X1Q3_9HYME|nr:hypothetical protein ALC60_06984 [Trachymyrmex zeteki]
MHRLCIPPRDSSHTYDSSDIAAQLLGNSACLHLFAMAIRTNVPKTRDEAEQGEKQEESARRAEENDKEKIKKKHVREITGETSISRSRGKTRISLSFSHPFLRERSTGKEIDRIPSRSTEQP